MRKKELKMLHFYIPEVFLNLLTSYQRFLNALSVVLFDILLLQYIDIIHYTYKCMYSAFLKANVNIKQIGTICVRHMLTNETKGPYD